jgi:hypothetical protein
MIYTTAILSATKNAAHAKISRLVILAHFQHLPGTSEIAVNALQ